jgi:hypothetical protein
VSKGAPKPDNLPGITAGNAYKLKGSASGEQMVRVLFEKEVERRVEEVLKGDRQEARDTRKDGQKLSDLTNAGEGLQLLLQRNGGIGLLQNKHLMGILRSHDVVPKGKQGDYQEQVLELIASKTPEGSDTSTTAGEMLRLTRAAEAAAQLAGNLLTTADASGAAATGALVPAAPAATGQL